MIKQLCSLIGLLIVLVWISFLVGHEARWFIFSGLSTALLVGYCMPYIEDKKMVRNGEFGALGSLVGYNVIWIIKGIFWNNVSSDSYWIIGIVSLGMILLFLIGKRIYRLPEQHSE